MNEFEAMTFFQFTLTWMGINLLLAIVPVVLSILLIRLKNRGIQAVFFLLWLLFLPNTMYLLTDIKHVPKAFLYSSGIELLILLIMFSVLIISGLLTYALAIYPLEKRLKSHIDNKYVFLIALNILVGIGLILGRVFRYNSWDFFIQPLHITSTTLHILSSFDYIIIIIFFSISATLFYIHFVSITKKLIVKPSKRNYRRRTSSGK